MTYRILVDTDLARWFCNKYLSLTKSTDQRGICLVKGQEVVAAVMFENYNGRNVFMHVAAIPGRRWMTRDFLYWSFHYPFEQLKVDRITGAVDEDNLDARRFNEHLGFREEARLKGAGAEGQDVILYVLHKDWCRYGKEGQEPVRSADRGSGQGERGAGQASAGFL